MEDPSKHVRFLAGYGRSQSYTKMRSEHLVRGNLQKIKTFSQRLGITPELGKRQMANSNGGEMGIFKMCRGV